MAYTLRVEILLEAIENFIDAKINWASACDTEYHWNYKQDREWVDRATKTLATALENFTTE